MNLSEWREHYADSHRRSEHIRRMKELNNELNCCIEIFDSPPPAATEPLPAEPAATEPPPSDPLRGVPFAIKDNIALAGQKLTCASKMLQDFISPYNATVVQRLLDGGAIPVAKTNLDEFGMGSSTEHSNYGTTHNPWDITRTAGGSSGGSAAAVAAGMVPFALGSDTGGSVRQPASFCGVYGLKPTYGALSRFGLVAYASSLETIGILASSVKDTRTVFEAIRGKDKKDQTTHRVDAPPTTPARTIGYVTEFAQMDPVIASHYHQTVDALKQMGYNCREVRIPNQKLISPAYYTIASAEASANLARYDAVKYGMRHGVHQNPAEMTRATRSAGFDTEVKLRILLGAYVLRSGFQKQYYTKAQHIRQHLTTQMSAMFTDIDLILLPTFPSLPFRLGGGLTSFQQKQADLFTCLANLTGQPALSIPASMEGALPVGMQFLAAHDNEHHLFDVALRYREHFKPPRPPHCLQRGTQDTGATSS